MKAHLLIALASVLSVVSFSALRVHAVSRAETADLSDFRKVDPEDEVPKPALKRALFYFKQYGGSFKNQKYIGIADFSKRSSEPRFHIVNVKSGRVESLLVAHGKGSDRENRGVARKFSNQARSEATSLGFYRTGEVYSGKHGRSLKLDGLSKTNSNARDRGVVVHAAWYVNEDRNRAGRSQGCLAVDPKERDEVIAKLRGGALVYAWAGQGAG